MTSSASGPASVDAMLLVLIAPPYRRRSLRDRDRWDDHRAEGVVERRRLVDARRGDDVHRLGHRVRIDGAVRVGTGRRADPELEVLRCGLEPARLVGAEAVLARQD